MTSYPSITIPEQYTVFSKIISQSYIIIIIFNLSTVIPANEGNMKYEYNIFMNLLFNNARQTLKLRTQQDCTFTGPTIRIAQKTFKTQLAKYTSQKSR